MNFYMPVKLLEEENCVRSHSRELASFGRKALLVTGRNSARLNGSLKDVTSALEAEGVSYALFDEIEENPSIETVMKAREAGLAAEADFVIGIGGGSPMDAAKAIALMMKHREEKEDYLFRKGADSSALPIVCIPTTCGTGSEVTPYSILTIHAKRTKSSLPHLIFADLALLDGAYLSSAPEKVLRDTAVDALGHLFESWLNTDATDYSRMCVTAGLDIWKRSLDVLKGSRKAGPEDYRNLLNASAMAGMSITHTGTSLPHGLSYYLTYEMGMAHGKAVGHFLTGYLREAPEKDRNFLLSAAGFSCQAEFEAFYDSACGREEIPDDLKEKALTGVLSNPGKLRHCPYPVDEAVLRRIIGF